MTPVAMISPKDAEEMVHNNKGVFVDVRTAGEALVEQVPGSVFLPFDLVNKQRLGDLGFEGKTPILVCRTGRRAQQAAESLAKESKEVAVLQGGVVQWAADGLSLTKGHRVLPIERQLLLGVGGMILFFTLLSLSINLYFSVLTILMSGGMMFAGITGSCGMARLLVVMPWNKSPLCGSSCTITSLDRQPTLTR